MLFKIESFVSINKVKFKVAKLLVLVFSAKNTILIRSELKMNVVEVVIKF